MPGGASSEVRSSPSFSIRAAGTASVVCVGLVLLPAGAARAEWRTQFGVDIGTASDSVLLIGELDQRATLYAKCLPKTERPAELSVHVFDGSSDPLTGSAISEIAISTDAGDIFASPGERRRVPGYVVTQWVDFTTIRDVIDAIIGARAELRVDVRSLTAEASWTASATGSTAAGRAFIEACDARLPPVSEDVVPEPAVIIPPPARAPVLPIV